MKKVLKVPEREVLEGKIVLFSIYLLPNHVLLLLLRRILKNDTKKLAELSAPQEISESIHSFRSKKKLLIFLYI